MSLDFLRPRDDEDPEAYLARILETLRQPRDQSMTRDGIELGELAPTDGETEDDYAGRVLGVLEQIPATEPLAELFYSWVGEFVGYRVMSQIDGQKLTPEQAKRSGELVHLILACPWAYAD